jgi:hypothetical protein
VRIEPGTEHLVASGPHAGYRCRATTVPQSLNDGPAIHGYIVNGPSAGVLVWLLVAWLAPVPDGEPPNYHVVPPPEGPRWPERSDGEMTGDAAPAPRVVAADVVFRCSPQEARWICGELAESIALLKEHIRETRFKDEIPLSREQIATFMRLGDQLDEIARAGGVSGWTPWWRDPDRRNE